MPGETNDLTSVHIDACNSSGGTNVNSRIPLCLEEKLIDVPLAIASGDGDGYLVFNSDSFLRVYHREQADWRSRLNHLWFRLYQEILRTCSTLRDEGIAVMHGNTVAISALVGFDEPDEVQMGTTSKSCCLGVKSAERKLRSIFSVAYLREC